MTLERSVHTVAPAPRRWLPFAILTTSLALGASALAIVASTAPVRVEREVVRVTVAARVVPVVPGDLAWEPRSRVMTCPTTDLDPAPHDVRAPITGAGVRVSCIGVRHDGAARDRGWVMTRGAGPDGAFYTADDGCRWTGVRCDR